MNFHWELEDLRESLFYKGDSLKFEPLEIIRVSFIPTQTYLSQIDIFLNPKEGLTLNKVFTRKFEKISMTDNDFFSFPIKNVHCCRTSKFSIWVIDETGQVITCHKDYNFKLKD